MTDFLNEVRYAYADLVSFLIKNNITIATCESCTGGLIASLITDNEGSSAVFRGGFVTYTNESKISCGVSADIIERHSVYSKECAISMAQAARKSFDSDIGIGVTGTFGNIDPVNQDASNLGEVYFAIVSGENVSSYKIDIDAQLPRFEQKLEVAKMIYKVMSTRTKRRI